MWTEKDNDKRLKLTKHELLESQMDNKCKTN